MDVRNSRPSPPRPENRTFVTCFWRQPDNLRFPAMRPGRQEAGLFHDVAPNARATPGNIAELAFISHA